MEDVYKCNGYGGSVETVYLRSFEVFLSAGNLWKR